MKKIWMFFVALLPMLVSCLEEPVGVLTDSSDRTIRAFIESEPSTRTALSPAGNGSAKVLWSEGDQIAVFVPGQGRTYTYSLTEGAGTPEGRFAGYGASGSFTAFYPVAYATGFQGGSIQVHLPDEQAGRAGSFGDLAAPMAAMGKGEQVSFLNLMSLLKISMTGLYTVTSLEFRANDPDIRVSGPGIVSFSEKGVPQLTLSSEGGNRIIQRVGTTPLNPDKATDFYLVLPPQAYPGGFTVRINTTSGYMEKSYRSDFTMVRAQIHASTPFAVRLDEGVDPSTELKGQGTDSSPFLIGSLSDLLLMQFAVNAGEGSVIHSSEGSDVAAANAYYRLTTDIDLSPVCGENLGRSWAPIGIDGSEFQGTFDGDGHKVTNMYINEPDSSGQGLFGYISGYKTISNLSVEGNVNAYGSVGLLAGNAWATFKNCHASGNVSGHGMYTGGLCGFGYQCTDCTNSADVSGTWYVGGLVGEDYSLNRCVNKGSVRATGRYAGGISGYSYSSSSSKGVYNCINYGPVSSSGMFTGGITGNKSRGYLMNCTNKGAVSGSEYVGGIVGRILSGKIFNNLNSGSVTASKGSAGGILGQGEADGEVRNCINTALVSSSSDGNGQYYGGIAGKSASDVRYCYWLYDRDKNLGTEVGIAVDDNPTTDNYPVTSTGMTGSDTGRSLYVSSGGKTYTYLLDALNAWAFDRSKQEESNNESGWADRRYSGWEFAAAGNYPSLSGLPAQLPGEGQSTLSVSIDQAAFRAVGGESVMSITSSSAYRVESMSAWIEAGGVQTSELDPHIWGQVFRVKPNSTGKARTGSITIRNEEGRTASVEVMQFGSGLNDSWKNEAFYHYSLVMRFTATWCGWCPRMNRSIQAAQEMYPDKLLHLALHGSGSDLIFTPYSRISSEYRMEGYPTGVVDGRIKISNNTVEVASQDIVNAAKETESLYGTNTGVEIMSILEDRKVTVGVNAFMKKIGDYKITVLLLEDGIINTQKDYEEDEHPAYIHDNVARMALTDMRGVSFTVDEDASTRLFSYVAEVPESYNLEKMRILVYIQKTYGNSTIVRTDGYGDYYVDNSATVKVGAHLGLRMQ